MVTYFLDTQQDSSRLNDSLLIDMLDFVLKQIYFVFDRQYFKQADTAMGARWAPFYANTSLGWWEETIIKGCTFRKISSFGIVL